MPGLPRSFGEIRAAYLTRHNQDWRIVSHVTRCPTKKWSRDRIKVIRMRMLKIRTEAFRWAKLTFPAEFEQFQSLFFKLAGAEKACHVPEYELLSPLSKYKKQNKKFLADFLGRRVERYLRAETRLLETLNRLSDGQTPNEAYISPERIEERRIPIEQTIFGQAAENKEVSEKSSMWMIMRHLYLQCEVMIRFPRIFLTTTSTKTHECLNLLKRFLKVEKSDEEWMSIVASIQCTLGKDNVLSQMLKQQFGNRLSVDVSPTKVATIFG